MKLKIDYLQNLVNLKQNDLNSLNEAFGSNVKYYNEFVQKQKSLLANIKHLNVNNQHVYLSNISQFQLSDNNASHIARLPQNKSLLDLELPKVVEFLPHLAGRTNLIQPKFKLSKGRSASIVIGVPTIKREKTSYLLETLKSLFDAMNDLEKADALVVVMIAEVFIKHQLTINV